MSAGEVCRLSVLLKMNLLLCSHVSRIFPFWNELGPSHEIGILINFHQPDRITVLSIFIEACETAVEKPTCLGFVWALSAFCFAQDGFVALLACFTAIFIIKRAWSFSWTVCVSSFPDFFTFWLIFIMCHVSEVSREVAPQKDRKTDNIHLARWPAAHLRVRATSITRNTIFADTPSPRVRAVELFKLLQLLYSDLFFQRTKSRGSLFLYHGSGYSCTKPWTLCMSQFHPTFPCNLVDVFIINFQVRMY